jgi:hypothetical protein
METAVEQPEHLLEIRQTQTEHDTQELRENSNYMGTNSVDDNAVDHLGTLVGSAAPMPG